MAKGLSLNRTAFVAFFRPSDAVDAAPEVLTTPMRAGPEVRTLMREVCARCLGGDRQQRWYRQAMGQPGSYLRLRCVGEGG